MSLYVCVRVCGLWVWYHSLLSLVLFLVVLVGCTLFVVEPSRNVVVVDVEGVVVN